MAHQETQELFKHVFEQAAGISFIWNQEPRKALKRPYGVLTMGASRSIGRDEFYYAWSGAGESAYAGERELSLNCQIVALANPSSKCARVFIERVRIFLHRADLKAGLRRQGLVFVDSTPVVDLIVSSDLRADSRVSFDTIWRQQESLFLPGVPHYYFDQVIVEGRR